MDQQESQRVQQEEAQSPAPGEEQLPALEQPESSLAEKDLGVLLP